jgi:hypothetical protein
LTPILPPLTGVFKGKNENIPHLHRFCYIEPVVSRRAQMSVLNRPYFRDEEAAHTFLESILWRGRYGVQLPSKRKKSRHDKFVKLARERRRRKRSRLHCEGNYILDLANPALG